MVLKITLIFIFQFTPFPGECLKRQRYIVILEGDLVPIKDNHQMIPGDMVYLLL
jgi:hypothetical protein